jgi:hypothetical protein
MTTKQRQLTVSIALQLLRFAGIFLVAFVTWIGAFWTADVVCGAHPGVAVILASLAAWGNARLWFGVTGPDDEDDDDDEDDSDLDDEDF